MVEKEIGNRGSKTITLVSDSVIVKEQRTDGSWQDVKSNHCLRFILIGFERSCLGALFLYQNPSQNLSFRFILPKVTIY